MSAFTKRQKCTLLQGLKPFVYLPLASHREKMHKKNVLISVHAPSVLAITQLAFVEGSRWPPKQ